MLYGLPTQSLARMPVSIVTLPHVLCALFRRQAERRVSKAQCTEPNTTFAKMPLNSEQGKPKHL